MLFKLWHHQMAKPESSISVNLQLSRGLADAEEIGHASCVLDQLGLVVDAVIFSSAQRRKCS
jgi:hypothetical protein